MIVTQHVSFNGDIADEGTLVGLHHIGVNVDTSPLYVYNTTVTDVTTNDARGFYAVGVNGTAKNCCSSGNTNDWVGNGWIQENCTAEDVTPVYLNSGSDDFHMRMDDTVCVGQGKDLSNDPFYPFDDDIDGQKRKAA